MSATKKYSESNLTTLFSKLQNFRGVVLESIAMQLYDKDPIIDPEMKELFKNPKDKQNIIEAIQNLKNNNDKPSQKVTLSNKESIVLSVD